MIIYFKQVYGDDPDPSTTTLKFDVASEDLKQFFWFKNNILNVANLDAETNGLNLKVNISLSDGVHIVFTIVTVTVIDINDNVPYFTNTPYAATVADTAHAGTKVLQITAVDDDRTNKNLTYILNGGLGDFLINRSTGDISVSDYATLSLQKMPVYNMTVFVQDSGSPHQTNHTHVVVYLNETNASPPTFSQLYYTFNFSENNDSVSAAVKADDKDGVVYSIFSGNEDNLFVLENISGIITLVNGSLDFEKKDEYTFVVQAKDKAAFPKTSTATVRINVRDVNEQPTVIIDTKVVFKQINSSKGEVLKVKSFDPDIKTSAYRKLTYSLHENGTKFFSIDPKSGALEISKVLDTAGNFSLNVTVTDGGGLSDSGFVLVIVSNITGYFLNTFVEENRTRNTVVYDLRNATASQVGLIFELENDKENFHIDNVSKVLYLLWCLDYLYINI